MKAYRFLLFGLLLLMSNRASAQTACPPGMTPYGVGVCGYDNSQPQQPVQPSSPQQSSPPPQWVSRWGAIATDSAKGVLGTATDLPSKGEAQRAAIVDCQLKGGGPCKLEVAYDNECAALVIGSNGYNVGADTTLDKVIQVTMKICTDAKNKDCHVYYSACSLPIRIQ